MWWRNYDNTLSRFDRIPQRDRQTDIRIKDGRTELLHQYRVSVCWRAITPTRNKKISPNMQEFEFNITTSQLSRKWHKLLNSVISILKTCLVFGPVGIGISVFLADSEDDTDKSFTSVSAPEELAKSSFAVWEIESSTDAVLEFSFAVLFISVEPDMKMQCIFFIFHSFLLLWIRLLTCVILLLHRGTQLNILSTAIHG